MTRMLVRMIAAIAALASIGLVTVARSEGSSPVSQAAEPARKDTPEEKMIRRFPQKVRVGDLVGLPVLDHDDVTLGIVQRVVRTPAGKIKLIVSYSKWFGWFGRPVAVPIEVVAILARQIDALDMTRQEFEGAPTWSDSSGDQPISNTEIIRIAVTRR
jgi:hypothetical protein